MNEKNYEAETLKEALKKELTIEKELDNAVFYPDIENLIENIERIRKERFQTCKYFTQEYLAKHAKIGYSTYKSYLNGSCSVNIKYITILRIVKVLQCRLEDIISFQEQKRD